MSHSDIKHGSTQHMTSIVSLDLQLIINLEFKEVIEFENKVLREVEEEEREFYMHMHVPSPSDAD